MNWHDRLKRSCAALAVFGFLARTYASGCSSHDGYTSDPADLTWIKSNLQLYVAVPLRGIFRLPINTGKLEPVALHPGGFIENPAFSGGGRHLLYQVYRANHLMTWLYDLKGGKDQALELGEGRRVLESPDGRWVVALPPKPGFGDRIMTFLDLSRGRKRDVPVPGGAGSEIAFTGFTWVSKPDRLAFRSARVGQDQVWTVQPDMRFPRPLISALQNAKSNQAVDDRAGRSGPVRMQIRPQMVVVATSTSLILQHFGDQGAVVAEAPSQPVTKQSQGTLTCGPNGIKLLDVIDRNYILYKDDDALRIYAVDEKRTATLPGGMGWELVR